MSHPRAETDQGAGHLAIVQVCISWVKWDPILSLIRQYALDVPIYIANHTFLILTGDDMELSQEESEVVAWFLSQHWSEF